MRTDTARTIAIGSAIVYRNLINLKRFAATVASGSSTHQLNITVTTGSQAISFPLDFNDSAAELPLDMLN